MNVALLTSARSWRGSGTSFANVARGLAQRGHTVRLCTAAPAVTAALAQQGLPVTELQIRHTGLREARALLRAVRQLSADVLLADKPRDLRLGALASLAARFALVYRHNVNRERPPADPLVRLAHRRVRLTVFLTEFHRAQARRYAPFMLRPPTRVIHEGVDLERFRPDPAAGRAFRERLRLGDGAFLLAVGALEWEKRYEWLLAALATLGAAAPPLVVCGEGGEAGKIRTQAAVLGLDVRLVGFLAADELRGAYNAATCLVHAGAVETFGLGVAEAMACGRPVVAVCAGTLPEVVGDAGLLAPADDATAFGRAVADLLADAARRDAYGAAARARALREFSLERMGREYGEALEAIARR